MLADADYTEPATKSLLQECSSQVKAGFLKRVYVLLALQLVLSGGIVCAVLTAPSARTFVKSRPEVVILSSVAGLFVVCILFGKRHQHPLNLVLLHIFTLLQGCTIAGVCALYADAGMGNIILYAFATTAGIFCALSAYTSSVSSRT